MYHLKWNPDPDCGLGVENQPKEASTSRYRNVRYLIRIEEDSFRDRAIVPEKIRRVQFESALRTPTLKPGKIFRLATTDIWVGVGRSFV